MTDRLTLGPRWKEAFNLESRNAPDFFEDALTVRDTPYADEIRTALSELQLSGVFCVNGVPTIALLRLEQYDSARIMELHAALWNQGLASILAVVSGDTVRIFSLAKTPVAGEVSEYENRCLINTLNAASSLLELRSLVSGAETGRIWRENKEYFKPGDRVDAVLLNNLEETHALLINQNLSSDEAQAILIQTMFIAYLEDRNIIGASYFQAIEGSLGTTWAEFLGSNDSNALKLLFQNLRRDFNGDLFVAPCSFSEEERNVRLTEHHLATLQRFRLGQEEMQGERGQLRFWGYDFRYIPVELISAVYDRFLGKDEASKKAAGAYYTPMFLADSVVSATWSELSEIQKESGSIHDPSCGSGVFLVRMFQRLCEHWRETRSSQTIRWDSLKKMLLRIHGCDINSGAVRVAVFSMYLALLEQVSPPDLRKLIDKKGLLPTLWNKTLRVGDFFETDEADSKFDVLVGNPPWTSRKGQDRRALQWANENGYPVPQGEAAWAFTWKGLRHLKSGGVLGFLLPAMGFLHNHAKSSIAARTKLFQEARVGKVINFSDLRFQLFEGAHRPAALFTASPQDHAGAVYEFEYWTPKADLNLAIKRFVTLSPIDRHTLWSSDVGLNGFLFKQKLWLRNPEAKLFAFLNRLPTLGHKIEASKTESNENAHWGIGQGFQPFYEGRSAPHSIESDFIGRFPNLSINQFTTLSVSPELGLPWHTQFVRRRGYEQGFLGPRVLIPQGVKTAEWRLRAAFVDFPLTFQDSLQVVSFPAHDSASAKLLAAILNSKLSLWFAFHGTSSFGADRPKVQLTDLTRLPFPSPEDLPNPEASQSARSELIHLISEHQRLHSQPLASPDAVPEILKRIDALTYEYFGLTDEEVSIIEDGAEFIIPSSQPNPGAFPQIWKRAIRSDREQYAKTLARSLKEWFPDTVKLGVGLIGRSIDFALLKISLNSEMGNQYFEAETEFAEALSNLEATIQQPIDQNFNLVPDLRLFIGQDLYLVKPLQKRFWLRSTALTDADSLALDLDAMQRAKSRRGPAR